MPATSPCTAAGPGTRSVAAPTPRWTASPSTAATCTPHAAGSARPVVLLARGHRSHGGSWGRCSHQQGRLRSALGPLFGAEQRDLDRRRRPGGLPRRRHLRLCREQPFLQQRHLDRARPCARRSPATTSTAWSCGTHRIPVNGSTHSAAGSRWAAERPRPPATSTPCCWWATPSTSAALFDHAGIALSLAEPGSRDEHRQPQPHRPWIRPTTKWEQAGHQRRQRQQR